MQLEREPNAILEWGDISILTLVTVNIEIQVGFGVIGRRIKIVDMHVFST